MTRQGLPGFGLDAFPSDSQHHSARAVPDPDMAQVVKGQKEGEAGWSVLVLLWVQMQVVSSRELFVVPELSYHEEKREA